MSPKLFAILCSLTVLIFVTDLIRREKMSFKYASAWLLGAGLALLLAIFDSLLIKLTHWTGFALLSNFLFFAFIVFMVILSLVLTIYINEQNKRTETLTQSLGIMEYRLKQLESKTPENKKD